MFKGKINQYTCDTCGGVITTIDRDEGTTSVFLACRVTPNCKGEMHSAMYRVDQSLTPDHEWYKPTGKVKPVFRDHVKRGGLLIRPVVGATQSYKQIVERGARILARILKVTPSSVVSVHALAEDGALPADLFNQVSAAAEQHPEDDIIIYVQRVDIAVINDALKKR